MNCYSLFSGSSGNALYLEDGQTRILVDAGFSMKRIKEQMARIDREPSSLSAILITHEHSDHTQALPMLAKYLGIPIYCQREVAKEMYLSLLQKGKKNEAAAFARCVRTVLCGYEYEIGSILVSPFSTPHDSVQSQGFVFGDRELGVATDLGCVTDEVSRYLLGCRNVVLESNHDLGMLWDGNYPPELKERVASDHGHLNNDDCAAFCQRLLQAGCESFTLFHLSEENNTPALAMQTTENALLMQKALPERDFSLRVASRYEVTKVL